MRVALVSLLALFCVSCTSYEWRNPVKGPKEYQEDSARCHQESAEQANDIGVLAGAKLPDTIGPGIDITQAEKNCMQRLGWQRVKVRDE